MDVVDLTKQLVSFKSITPNDAGALVYIKELLSTHFGARCNFYESSGVSTLHSIIGNGGKKLCFLGHVDVVPVCNNWSCDPFVATIKNDAIYGRGVCDMKGAIAAFISSLFDIKRNLCEIHLVLTSDEEGDSIGIKHAIHFLPDFDFIVVGEPTNPNHLGEMIKIGRRGSLNGILKVDGTGGHIAYPDDANNPIPKLIKGLNRLFDFKMDKDSSLQISSIETDTKTANIIPSKAKACFNIRFSKDDIPKKIEKHMDGYDVIINVSAEPFITKLTKYHEILKNNISNVTNKIPCFSTSGGTSEGRFLKDLGPIAEFGLISNQAHKVDEHVMLFDLISLRKIYFNFLTDFQSNY